MNAQTTWFVLVAILLAGYAVLDGSDLGIGVLYPFLARNRGERAELRAAAGPVWDGNELWLLASLGALFAAFPPVYTFVAGSPMLILILIFASLGVRALALVWREHGHAHATAWDGAIYIGSLLPAFLLGVVLANTLRGVPLTPAGDYAGTFWQLLNPFALLVGATGLALLVGHGASWAAFKTEGHLRLRAVQVRSGAQLSFVALFALVTVQAGFNLSGDLRRFVSRPLGWGMIALLIAGLIVARFGMSRRWDLAAFLGSAVTVAAVAGIAAVSDYPTIVAARSSAAGTALTVARSSSSGAVLSRMLILAAAGVPIVVGYTVLARLFSRRPPGLPRRS
jgi:cytochrome d ubiquinol oxidase subunit II